MDGEVIPPGANLPALVEPSTVRDARVAFTDGATSTRQSFVRYAESSPFGLTGHALGGSFTDGFSAAARNPANRESALAAAMSQDLLSRLPILSTIAENLATAAVGTGLVLSAKPDAEALGITPQEARTLTTDLEKGFKAWADNPRECDLRGMHTLHQLAFAGFTSYLIQGELLATVDWATYRDATTRTKISLLDPSQLDRSKNQTGAGFSIFMGVECDARGRVTGFYLRKNTPGRQFPVVMPTRVAHSGPWGRPIVLHLYDLKGPGQYRGLSPFVAALAPALEKSQLAEFALEAALVGTAFSATIESDMPSSDALARQGMGDGLDMGQFAGDRREFYKQNQVRLKPGQVNHLPQGDHMKFNKSEAPNSTFDTFDKSLGRSAAMAAGLSYEQATGDLSQTSFSAARIALEGPWRINLRRRAAIVERFYRACFEAWAEEAIVTGRVKVPAHAPAFITHRDAYCKSTWIGIGRISADPKKTAEADILEVENNFATLQDKLAERGIVFDDFVAQRKFEREQLAEADLPVNEPGATTTQRKITEALPPDKKDED